MFGLVFDTAMVFVFGLIFGSFANVVILRLPLGKSIVRPRSHCPACAKTILWYDNIPVLSWLLLRGRCRFCQIKISYRYPLIEFIMGVLFASVFYKVGWSWLLLEYLIFVFAGLCASAIDLDHLILPDTFTLGGLALGLLGGLVNPERDFMTAFYGVMVGGGFLLCVAYGYYWLRGEEGMGGGDIKLLGWIGAVLGWQAIPFVILASSLLGSVVGVIVMIKNKSGLRTQIPFGPYLYIAAVAWMILGPDLSQMVFGSFSLTSP